LFGIFDFRFTYIEPINKRKNEVEGLEDQGRLQKRPKVEDPSQNQQTKKYQNAAFGKRRNDKGGHHQGLPVVVSTDRGGVTHGCVVWMHDRASRVCPKFFGFFRAFSFSCAIFRFLPFKR